MTRSDRMLAILLELQRRGVVRAEDLAKRLETSVRTIYRDMEALSIAGIPLRSTPGIGYELMEGFFLPPIQFTALEASMLLLGGDYIANTFDHAYGEIAHTAQAKIEAIMPEQQRLQVRQLRDSIHYLNLDETYHIPPIDEAEQQTLGLVRRAVLEQRALSFTYRSRRTSPYASEEEAPTARSVHPYGLFHSRGSWSFVGHCTLRGELRQFRLDRMASAALLTDTFERPESFRMNAYEPEQNFYQEVTVSFAKAAIPWVRENPSFYLTSLEEREHDALATFHCRQEEDLLQWVLSWGQHARVLQPQSLRDRVREHAAAMAAAYAELE
ncbi:helix-turn-helix type 11 domain protein [Paenibacillus curdlanolyticus YK9]|uniref:Helix-turn-helix type 11 domain protein n=1 Tax=Paenibacillus curdlanolyticus YK9 TaxID=717606 RepID=E0IGE2_9BACL|nr:YafY family protein [Paenibacillus curdlanolyticus]EFM08442.1 helix-turn-helix type 11 domain protein [Paenibacillus curdlanolyticus YK9]